MNCHVPISKKITVFVSSLHTKQLSQFQILLETNIMPSPLSLISVCYISSHFSRWILSGRNSKTGMLYLLFKDSQLCGQDTQVWNDSNANTTFQIRQPALKTIPTIHNHKIPKESRLTPVSVLPSPQRTCNLLGSRNYSSH